MTKKTNFWLAAAKVFMMSVFASIVSFMLNCLVVIMANKAFFDGEAVSVRILMQVMELVVELIFIYGVLWEIGHHDQRLCDLGQASYSPLRGMRIGLAAAIPYYLLAVVMLLMVLDVLPDITGLLRAAAAQFWGIYTFLLPVEIGGDGQAVGVAFAKCIATPLQASLAVLVPTIIPLLAHLPYFLGRRGIAIGERLLFTSKKKK